MAKVRSRGNRSTEGRAEAILLEHGITGWIKHPSDILGSPDFYFPKQRLALFVDGCFWHACPRCGRIPKSRVDFWVAKIDANRRRDNRTRRSLRQHKTDHSGSCGSPTTSGSSSATGNPTVLCWTMGAWSRGVRRCLGGRSCSRFTSVHMETMAHSPSPRFSSARPAVTVTTERGRWCTTQQANWELKK